MMTREEYFESLRKLNLKVYMFGKAGRKSG